MKLYQQFFVFLFLQLSAQIDNYPKIPFQIKNERTQNRQQNRFQNRDNFKFKQDAEDEKTEDEPTLMKKQGFMRLASDSYSDIVQFPPIPNLNDKDPAQQLLLVNKLKLQKLSPPMKNKGNFRQNSQFKQGGEIPTEDSFYFRLSDNHLLYTEKPTDSLVLQAIEISNIQTTQSYGAGCFKVQDKEKKEWILCSIDGSCPEAWRNAISTAIGQPCEPCPEFEQPQLLEISPQIIIPVAAPNCKFDWNYNYHGQNWVCNCNEGLEQSPIDLPPAKSLSNIQQQTKFDFINVTREDLEVIYDINCFKIRTKNEKIFGTITDLDGTSYEGYEIQFHTPGEHTLNGLQIDMEIQVIHKAVQGNMAKQAILSVLWQRTPGEHPSFFDLFDLLNLPTPIINVAEDNVKDDLNVYNLIYDTIEDIRYPPPFNYYNYVGSRTAPPCEEDVVWFIYEDVRKVSSTVLAMIRDVINIPLQPSSNTNLNFDGSNRQIQPLRKRKIFFFDKNKSCFASGVEHRQEQEVSNSHYEKITKNVNKYMYIDGLQPSGIKDALVVSQNEADNLNESYRRVSDRYDIKL